MVHYESEETLPLNSAHLWSFLQLHTTEKIHEIHPEIQAQDIQPSSGGESRVTRTIDMRGRSVKSVWKVTVTPPGMMRWEIVEGEGPWTVGSYLENTYAEVPGGVRVRTVAELKVVKVPFFLQRRIVGSVLDHISEQDLAYLKAHP